MKTINQNLYFINLSISSKNQFFILFLFLISPAHNLFAQNYNGFNLNADNNHNADTTKRVQYRRTIEPNENQQSYEQKYFGKDLNEVKRSLFPLESTGIWTELNPKVPRVDYIGVHFVNKDTGWACGDLGALIKTTNGGIDWTVSQTNTTTPILKIKSFDGLIVLASGYDGLILRSIDGGETFTQVTSGVTGDLWGLEIVNDTLGWACGATTLLNTTDAGESWQIVNTPGYTGNLWAVEFLNDSYGFISADGKVLRTANGGADWEIIQAGDNQALYIVDIIDSLHIAAAGYGGTSYRGKNLYSSDGGFTWITGGPLTFEPVNDIKYVNRDTGYVVMNNTIGFKTTNRGQQWTSNAVGGDWEMQFFKEQNFGYSVGTGLRIYKTENSFENWQRLIINDNFSDVFFVNEETGFATSGVLSVYQGLYKTTNGGVNWNGIPGPSGQDILFLDSLTGFIGSDVINKTTDGGTTWYIPNGGQGGAGKIFFINQTIGWAIRSNSIYKTTDRGENWFTQFIAPSSIGFQGIHFVDSLYGWTANSNGRPYKTIDGGNNWIQQTNLNFWQANDVYFTSIDTGFVINGFIGNNFYETFNGGLNWQSDPMIDAAYNINFFPNKYHWILNGVHQRWETNDNGLSWTEISQDVPTGFNQFHAPREWIGYAVGGSGLILKYFDTSYVPVELISFEGTAENGKNILKWQTVSELNNRGFLVEKSFTKKNWLNIGFVEGNGTTVETNYYSFTDSVIESDVIFYRLKQVDYDGTYQYSKVIEIFTLLKISSFQLYHNFPNPFNSSTIITYAIAKKNFVNISLFSLTGEQCLNLVNEEKDKGIYRKELSMVGLPSGIYFIQMTTSAGFTAVNKIALIK